MVNEKRTPKISIGITSLMVILTVLCLTVFSVLTLSTAVTERNLSQKSASSVKNYYEAEQICAKIANEAGDLWQKGCDREELEKLLAPYGGDCRQEEDAMLLSYAYPVDEGQRFYVTLRLDESFTVLRWQVGTVAEWTPDEDIPVWNGEMEETEIR